MILNGKDLNVSIQTSFDNIQNCFFLNRLFYIEDLLSSFHRLSVKVVITYLCLPMLLLLKVNLYLEILNIRSSFILSICFFTQFSYPEPIHLLERKMSNRFLRDCSSLFQSGGGSSVSSHICREMTLFSSIYSEDYFIR